MAIDLGSWLRDRKKQLEGAVAQVNPLDNGKTYNTVVNNRPPVQPVQRAQPVRQVNQQQPGWSVRRQPSFEVVRPPKTTSQLVNESYGTGFTSVANRLKDVINRDTKADQIKRRSQTGLNESYDQQQERLNNAAYNNPDKRNLQDQVRASVSRNVATIFNKTPGAVANLYGSALQTKNPIAKGVLTAINPAIGLATVFGGKKSQKVGQNLEDFGNNLNKGIDNRIQQGSAGARKTDNRWVDPIASGGVQVAGNILAGGAPIISQSIQSASNQTNQARAKGRTDEQALGIGVIQGLVSYGSERIGMDKLLRGGGGFVKKVLTEGAQEAQQQFTENAITNQLYDKTQGFLAGVPESFVGGLAGGTLGASSSKLMSNSQEPTTKLTPQVQPNIQRARPEEYNVLSDYQDVLHGNIKNPTVINQTIQAARQAGQRLGLDVTSGSVSDINQRINAVLSQQPQVQQVADPVVTNMPVNQMTDPQSMRARIRAAKERVLTPLNEGGYIAGPLALDFSKAQAEGKVFEGVDGKPRFEVDDSGAKLKKDSFTNERLADVLDHPELFRQYPALKDLRVVSQPQFRKTHNNASYDRGANAIAVNPDHMRTGNALKSTLLHEIQHAVQTNEQFARGGDLESAMGAILEARDKNRSELSEFFAKHRDKAGNVPEQHRERLRQLQSEQQRLMEIEAMARHTDGRYAYDRLAGEAEARAVQARMNMPMSERYVEPDGRTLYHGSPVADTIKQEGFKSGKGNALLGEGVYLTPSRDKAGNYTIPRDYDYSKPITEEMRNKGIIEAKIPQNAKIFTPKTRAELKTPDTNYGDPKLITEKFKKLGYDGIELNGEVVIFDPSKVSVAGKPRSTFYDSLDVPKEDLIIRNGDGKAMSVDKVDPLESLKREARKYKSAEEFTQHLGRQKAAGDPATTALLSDMSSKAQKLIDGGMSSKAAANRVFNDTFDTLRLQPENYKTLDEFINAQGKPFYHGTDANFDRYSLGNFGKTDQGFTGKGIYLSGRKGNARQYGKNVVESYANLKNPLEYTDSYIFGAFSPDGLRARLGLPPKASAEEVTAALKSRGHDGVVIHEDTGTGIRKNEEVVVLDPTQVRTKQQLTDLYNQAHAKPKIYADNYTGPLEIPSSNRRTIDSYSTPKPSKQDPLEALKAEARKYKSAEEFVKAQSRFTHESATPNIDKFDMNRVGSGQGDSWLGKGIYAQENGTLKLEKYGNNKTDVSLSPNAKIFEVQDTPNGQFRDSFVEFAVTNKLDGGLAAERATEGLSSQNLLARDIFRRNPNITEELKKLGYDGLKQDGELVVYNTDVLLTGKQLTDLYNQATQKKSLKDKLGIKPLNEVGAIGKDVRPDQDPLESLKQEARKVTDDRIVKNFEDELAGFKTKADWLRSQDSEDLGMMRPEFKAYADAYYTQSQPPKSTPFEKDLQTAGLAPKKAKGLIVSETKPINGQKIQKVRTGKGQVEQRLVQDRSSEIADALGVPQDQRDPSFNAVAAAKNSSSAKRLVAALNSNEDISQAAAQAQQDGKEINFFAKKDANGRSVGVERFNPKYHKIEAGFVTDRDGNVLGNHIKVDATGVQVNVGGDLVNMESVLGNPNSWRNKYETSSTMERNIYKNAPTKEIADKTYKFTVAHKIQSEANFKTELSQQRKDLAARTKATMAAKPRKTSDTEYKSDMFDFIENNATYTDMVGKYGQNTAKVMSDYKIATRTMYNDLLKRVNEKFQQFGIDPVPQRKDYLTHINELMNKQSYIGELAGQLQNSITGEGSERTRGAVPGDIAGRTENFKPTKKWNKFFQERKGGEFTKDPFKAVDAYLEPTLHNIHMTESGVRTRAVEAAFRTAAQLKAIDTSYVTKELDDSLAKFKVQGKNDKLIRGFQEYANAITGKTQAWDRQVIDSSEAGATTLRGWQKLQGVAGRATILGNANSVLMQPLNQVATLSQVGPVSYLRGLAASVSGDKSIKQSPFITARQAKADSNFKTRGQRVMDAGGVPLEMVEMASVKATWHAQHQAVIKDGYKGQEAIIETDRRTERTVAGRGIADKPELYRSTLANGVLQYTLEVNAQNKMFMRDLTPKQKATFLVATLGVNSVLGAVTGNTPLPDFLKAALDSIKDFADGEEGDSVIKNVGQTAQRFAGEAASMNPLATGAANLLPKGTRQALFGKESALGRYEGTSAPIQVIKNAVDAGSNLVQGKYKDARNSALKDIPFGNQIQKTVRGAEAIADGKTEGSPWQGAKALAFGPNAISTDTAKADRPRSSTSSTSKGTVNAISVGGKTTSDLGDAGNVDNILKAQFSTKEQQKWLALTAKEREAEAKQDPEKAKWLKQYEATKRVNKDAPDLPDGISDESKKILEWHDKRTAQQKEKLAYSQNDYDYKLAKANYEKDTLNGTISRAEQINRKQSLKKAEIGTKFTKDTRESYNSLSKAELQELAANDENGQKIWDDAVAYGDELVKAGIIKKNKLRSGSRGGGRRKGSKKGKGSRGGKLGAIDFGTTDLVSTNKRLQALLGGTTVKPVKNKKVTVKKPKLKKVA